MGHDLYIQARIREKRTERVISCGDSDDYAAQEDIGFFDICWWCGSPECDVRIRMMENAAVMKEQIIQIPICLSPFRHQRCVPFMRMW